MIHSILDKYFRDFLQQGRLTIFANSQDILSQGAEVQNSKRVTNELAGWNVCLRVCLSDQVINPEPIFDYSPKSLGGRNVILNKAFVFQV